MSVEKLSICSCSRSMLCSRFAVAWGAVNFRFSSGVSSGSGIYNSGTLNISNSTFSGNSTDEVGGGIYNVDTLSVVNSTFSGNSAMLVAVFTIRAPSALPAAPSLVIVLIMAAVSSTMTAPSVSLIAPSPATAPAMVVVFSMVAFSTSATRSWRIAHRGTIALM